jgi:hypothetical protein
VLAGRRGDQHAHLLHGHAAARLQALVLLVFVVVVAREPRVLVEGTIAAVVVVVVIVVAVGLDRSVGDGSLAGLTERSVVHCNSENGDTSGAREAQGDGQLVRER